MQFAANASTLAVALLPFVAALLAPLLTAVLRHNAGWLLAAVPAAMFVHFLGYLGPVSEGQRFIFGVDWVPALGVRYQMLIDGLSLIFALLITGIGTLIIIYAGGYLKGHPQQGRFFSFMLMFMGAMLGLVLADDLLSLFVFWELTSITSFLLIGFDHARPAARRAALQALVVTGGGGLALLAGLLLAGWVGGVTSMSGLLALGGGLKDSPYYTAIFVLVLAGAFTKSAQVPFHFWLPNAMEAPTPVSAYLHSATMVKAGVYLLMRMQPALGDTTLWTTVLPLFGGLTLLTGALLAVRQTDLKLMLAQTTVASLGLLVMLIGTSNERVIEGAALYLVAHSLFKGALFMVAGGIDHEAGTRDVTKLGGLRKAMPITFVAAMLAALSMGGLPPFVGFLAKEVLYDGLAHMDGATILVAAAVIGNVLMFAIAFAVALKPFAGPEVHTPKHAHEAPPSLWLGPLVLSIAAPTLAIATAWTGQFIAGPIVASILGRPFEADLHLIPTYVSVALILSLVTIALGIAAYLGLARLRGAVAAVTTAVGWGPDRGFDQAVSGLVRLATVVRRLVQPGGLEVYITTTVLFIVAALLVPPLLLGVAVRAPVWPHVAIYEWTILGIAVLGLIVVTTAASRLVSIIALGVQGFAVAVIFLLFGAPDLSFTQFMVETLSVVILALVMVRLNLTPSDHRPPLVAVRDLVIAGAAGVGFTLLLLAVVGQPFNSALSDFFAENSRAIAHGRNIVNVIIVDFRGLDTLGEIAVVMVTGLAVLALIGLRPRRRPVAATPSPAPVAALTEGRP
jgi:multicomponent Na+:H+ antiporter subunit A